MNLDEMASQLRFVLRALWVGMMLFVCILAIQGKWLEAGFVFVVVSVLPFLVDNAFKEAKRYFNSD